MAGFGNDEEIGHFTSLDRANLVLPPQRLCGIARHHVDEQTVKRKFRLCSIPTMFGACIQSFTVTAFSSVNASTPSCPSSRPQPDSLKPPNGRLGSKTLKQFTQTAPAFNACAKRNALETSRVQMLAAKP